MVAWPPNDDGTGALAQLNALGEQGWSAIGLAPRAVDVMMPGMNAQAVPEMVVLLQRPAR